MEILPLIIGVAIPFTLVLFAYAIKYRKAYWLISGYNMMSDEKKRNVNVEELGRFLGNCLFIMAAVVFVSSVLIYLRLTVAAGIVFALLMPLSIYMLIKSQAFDGNTKKPDGTMKKISKAVIGVVVGFLLLVSIGVGVLMYLSSKPSEYTIQDGALEISGLYGEEIKLSEVSSIEIKYTIPEILYKSNGSALQGKDKGYFKLKDLGEAKLFVDTNKPPFIYLETDMGLRIINTGDSEKTEKLYRDLLSEWK